MQAQEKLISRAWLIADGISRNHKWQLLTPGEMAEALEILAEELVKIRDHDEAQKIRVNVERHGLQIPQQDETVQDEAMCEQEFVEKTGHSESRSLCSTLTSTYTQLIPVHPAAGPGMQEQQSEGDTQSEQMCGALRNSYTQEGIRNPVHADTATQTKAQQSSTDRRDATRVPGTKKGLHGIISAPAGGTGSWTWRDSCYRRVPPAIEEAVRAKFKQGSSKSQLAREFRLNRRTIIRICNSNVGTAQIV